MKKRILSVFFAVALLLAMLPQFSFASQQETGITIPQDQTEQTASLKQDGALSKGGILKSPAKATRAASYDHSHDEEIVAAMENLDTEIPVAGFGITQSNIGEVVSNLLNTNPQLFYINSRYSYSYNPSSGEVTTLRFTYDGTEEEIREKQQEVDAAIEEAMESVQSSALTEEEIALAYHDYLVSNIAYAYDDYLAGTMKDSVYNIYGALVEQEAVCQGYALAYLYFLQKEGITCGIASSDAANHAWNLIKIDGKWYHADATWDDPVYDNLGRVYHTYFLISTETLLADESSKSDYIAQTSAGITYQEAEDSSFENGFWTNSESVIHYYNGAWYYMDADSFRLMKYDYQKGTSETIQQEKEAWYVYGSTASVYKKNYSRLVGQNKELYYTTPTVIYKLDLQTGEKTKIYTIDGTDGYFYGLGSKDGTLSYVVKKTPASTESETIQQTELNLSHIWVETSRIEATCMKEGQITEKCSKCGQTRSETIPPTRDISGCRIVLEEEQYEYNGNAIRPKLTLQDGEIEVPAQNYKAQYSNSDGIGEATVTLTGTNGYIGTVKASYVILHTQHQWEKEGKVTLRATCLNKGERQYACVYSEICSAVKTEDIPATGNISDCEISLEQNSYEYDGTAKEPRVTVKDGDQIIPDGQYEVEYRDNKLPGTASVCLTGQNGISGNATAEFSIVHTRHQWDSGQKTKEPTCTQEGEVEYHCLLDAICQKTKIEKIAPTRDISGCRAVFSPAVCTYNGKGQQPAVALYDGSVKVEKSAYTVKYTNNRNAGTAIASIAATGTYQGGLTASFTIKKAANIISSASAFTKVYGSKPFSLNAKNSANSSMSYRSGNKNIAVAGNSGRVTLTGPGKTVITVTSAASANYNAGTKRIALTVKPKQTTGVKVKKGKKRMTVRWKRDKKATGYQITYAQNKAFKKGKKNILISKSKTTKRTIRKLKSGKTYYVKVRTYKKSGNTKIYGAYSKVRKVKIR